MLISILRIPPLPRTHNVNTPDLSKLGLLKIGQIFPTRFSGGGVG